MVWIVCNLLFIACFVIFIAMVDGVDDPYPSLSDFHDYEPNLEFDDSDLLNSQHSEVEGKMLKSIWSNSLKLLIQ